ncbi:MAG: peptidylprolyl isomerase [Sphaerochaetaceae bacterium]
MKRIFTILSLFLLSVATAGAAVINSPAATVNLTQTVVITTDALNEKLKTYQDALTANGQDPTQVQALDILNTMINDELFRQGAARDKVAITDSMIDQAYDSVKSQYVQNGYTADQFKQAIVSNFGSIDSYRNQLKDQLLVQQYLLLKKSSIVNAAVSVSDSEIQAAYRKNKSQLILSENVKISHIFIPYDTDKTKDAQNKATMISVAKQIKEGTLTFEQAVTQYSQDSSSKNKAGDIGWLTVDNTDAVKSLGSQFIDTAFEIPVGSTSDLIESLQGYHIVKILAHNDTQILGLDDKVNPESTETVRDYLKSQLEYSKQQTNYQNAINSLLDDLRKQATIKVLYK